MNEADFQFIATLLLERSGLTISQEKLYLLETRLLPLARRHGLNDVSQLISELRTNRLETLMTKVIEAMTTNETLFFRDNHPFEALRTNVLPALIAARTSQRKLRIWCAACSTGQEPYSLAILLRESFPELASWRVEIQGTDIADKVLERAREGIYSAFEVQRGLPVKLLVKHFDQLGDRWQVKADIRRMVSFHPFNLLDDPSAFGMFDVIFCRNVLIYFDFPTKCSVLERLGKRLVADGALLLGGAESIIGHSNAFESFNKLRGIYRKSDPANAGKSSLPHFHTVQGAMAKAAS